MRIREHAEPQYTACYYIVEKVALYTSMPMSAQQHRGRPARDSARGSVAMYVLAKSLMAKETAWVRRQTYVMILIAIMTNCNPQH